jgi:hypothetical protein
VMYVAIERPKAASVKLDLLKATDKHMSYGSNYVPLFLRSSARATLAALTKGASVASGSAICMKPC